MSFGGFCLGDPEVLEQPVNLNAGLHDFLAIVLSHIVCRRFLPGHHINQSREDGAGASMPTDTAQMNIIV